ncbi:DUF3224 domain-containing protein [Umezawaea sp.]|uniref:DUF3224 domain-containing protein n=1 Tax=Umezawaea sp. TaxID=1955258 RepID=UPI002ED49F9A
MTTHAAGSIDMKSWDEKTWDGKAHDEVSGAKQTAGTMVCAYRGALEATGETRFVMTYVDDDNCYTIGHELVTGTLDGRSGTFVLQHIGRFKDGYVAGGFTVVPESGTGELEGLSGSGGITWEEGKAGAYTVDYVLSA